MKKTSKNARKGNVERTDPAAGDGASVPAGPTVDETEFETARNWLRGGYFAKGGKAGPGRPKGSLNKTTAIAKEAIIATFHQLQALHPGVGDHPDMLDWAKHNRTEFYRMFARLLPFEVDMRDGSIALVVFKGLNG